MADALHWCHLGNLCDQNLFRGDSIALTEGNAGLRPFPAQFKTDSVVYPSNALRRKGSQRRDYLLLEFAHPDNNRDRTVQKPSEESNPEWPPLRLVVLRI